MDTPPGGQRKTTLLSVFLCLFWNLVLPLRLERVKKTANGGGFTEVA